MEYLPRPRDPTLPPLEIVFHHPEKYSSEVKWEDFPKAHGYQGQSWWDDSSPHHNRVWSRPEFQSWILDLCRLPQPDLEDLAIAWLYFGTLREVTSCHLDLKHHLRVNSDGQNVLCMTKEDMDALLERWVTLENHFKGSSYLQGTIRPRGVRYAQDTPPEVVLEFLTLFQRPASGAETRLDAEGKSARFERCYGCLKKTQAILGALANNPDGTTSLSKETTFAIAALGEFLTEALQLVFQGEVATAYIKGGVFPMLRWVTGADFCHYAWDGLERQGWCPRTLWSFKNDKTRTLTYDHFALNLESPQSKEDHSACSEAMCQAYQLNEADYPRLHSSSSPRAGSCDCNNLLVDPEICQAVLLGDESSPLVLVNDKGGLENASVEILDSADNTEYVAISHVWSQGLGNPTENSLPACRLMEIQTLVNNLALQVNGARTEPMPFWMDTLCCPLEPKEARKAAIMKMKMTYERASHVLVIDRNLIAIKSSEVTDLEVLARAFGSVWMTRLWTLQEARFAKRLWFQFGDKAVDIDELHQRHKSSVGPSSAPAAGIHGFVDHVVKQLVLLRTGSMLESLRHTSPHVAGATVGDLPIDGDRRPHPADDSVPGDNVVWRFTVMCYSVAGRSTSWAGDEAICLASLLGLDLRPILDVPTSEPQRRMAAFWRQWPRIPTGTIFSRAPRLLQPGLRWAPATILRSGDGQAAISRNVLQDKSVVDTQMRGVHVTIGGLRLETASFDRLGRSILDLARDDRWSRKEFLVRAGRSGLGNFTEKWYSVKIEKPVHASEQPAAKEELNGTGLAIVMPAHQRNPLNEQNEVPGLLVSVKETSDGVIYCDSLYHLMIQQAEEGAAMLNHVADTLYDMASQGGLALHSPLFNTMMNMGLSEPRVQAYLNTHFSRNADKYPEWLAASESQRQDWEFRCLKGDVYDFSTNVFNYWTKFMVSVSAVPESQRWCID